ncbi:hypothetical protein [Phaeodactylibacter luteus]|uniref:Lipocalin-like domain-containing protein n=1 Tax=Phaeodactylibacter luteus TaxID=1564516 RepID=A0A5C6RSJ0_9BACT|nr:hypothetical protein [Phaeodactylibacter luteus]TXB64914.1 hypothetical protein FRY97_06730 [Phaeodactylibacter luteus]
MKKLLFLALVALVSCTSNEAAKQQLIGNWQYNKDAMVQAVKEREAVSDQEILNVQQFADMYSRDVFVFQEDGQLLLNAAAGSPLSGTWELNADGSELTINLGAKGKPSKILSISGNKLVLEPIAKEGRLNFPRIFKRVE